MRHPLILWLAAAAIVLGMARPAVTAHADEAGPAVYLALGDSVAAGVGASRDDKGYVPRFVHFLANHAGTGLTLNLAVPGETSGSFIAGGQLADAVAAIDEPGDVQVVTLTVGGNDLLHLLQVEPCRSTPGSILCRQAVAGALMAFVPNYQQILAALTTALANDPGEEVLLVTTYYNAFAGTGLPYEAVADLALTGSDGTIDCAANAADPTRIGLNDLIACIGQQFGATVVDLYPVFGRDALLLTHIAMGDIHPNDDGYGVIASALKQAWKQTTTNLRQH